eukprot:185508-Chlamydomonas_euryale.AAC.1
MDPGPWRAGRAEAERRRCRAAEPCPLTTDYAPCSFAPIWASSSPPRRRRDPIQSGRRGTGLTAGRGRATTTSCCRRRPAPPCSTAERGPTPRNTPQTT